MGREIHPVPQTPHCSYLVSHNSQNTVLKMLISRTYRKRTLKSKVTPGMKMTRSNYIGLLVKICSKCKKKQNPTRKTFLALFSSDRAGTSLLTESWQVISGIQDSSHLKERKKTRKISSKHSDNSDPILN